MEKDKKVWSKVFSPPCPKCGSTRTKSLTLGEPFIMTGTEFFQRLANKLKKEANKPVQSWECLDCETEFDEKGRYIAFEK